MKLRGGGALDICFGVLVLFEMQKAENVQKAYSVFFLDVAD
jgi:hypothetical protein